MCCAGHDEHARAPALSQLEARGVFAREPVVLGQGNRDAHVGWEAGSFELALKLAALCQVARGLGVLDQRAQAERQQERHHPGLVGRTNAA